MKKSNGVSLHIGLNSVDPAHYAGWSGPLNACEADAEDMVAIAEHQGFSATLLKTGQATRNTVIDGIRNAAKKLSEGDIFFLSYSGHGGQLPDINGDEYDQQDETWCLYDGELIDDELYDLWADFKEEVRILVLSDSCHSGTVVKAAMASHFNNEMFARAMAISPDSLKPQYRAMPNEFALRTYRQNRSFYDKLMAALPEKPRPIKAAVRLISGCQDNQYSLDGPFNGLFTGTLLRVWGEGRFNGNYSRFHKTIQSNMPSTQSPNHYLIGNPNPVYDSQKPFTI